jgi:tRNA U54 and U55 pseudouridine synthase Pus10
MPPTQARGLTRSSIPAPTKKARTPAAKWSHEEMTSMVSQLVQAKIDGQTSDPLKKNTRVCDTKFSRMKKDYKEVRKLLKEISGFGWNSETQTVTAEDAVWEALGEV